MHLPESTYRVQLHQEFPLEQLTEIIGYLHELGISTIYAAPIARAAPGSMHGYDVTDPHNINPEVGDFRQFKELSGLLRAKNMEWLQDIVPNHMAFSFYNIRLMDVLEREFRSPYYKYFDIDWEFEDPELKGKLMAPFLGDDLKECLRKGEIKLEFSNYGITVNYFDNRFPVSIDSLALIIRNIKDPGLEEHFTVYQDTASKISGLSDWLPFKKKWIAAIHGDQAMWSTLKSNLEELSNDASFLDTLLRGQNYYLTSWKETQSRINYRRFFTVNSLICLRMEDDFVFDDYHKFFHRLYKEGLIHGLRIDHIDGLSDPTGYIEKLRRLFGPELYIIAEKILESAEELPAEWDLQGTSGYEFLSYVNKLFTDRKGARELVEFYKRLVPGQLPYGDLVLKNKKLILAGHMAGELHNLATYFVKLELGREFTFDQVKTALGAFMLALPVYRIYPDQFPLRNAEMNLLSETFKMSIRDNPSLERELTYLKTLFLGEDTGADSNVVIRYLKRLMQFTGPLTAKGVEDTTFYIFNPLISHDEVGDSPSTLGMSIDGFHKRMIKRTERNTLSLNATATHDTKRGEDARIRLNVLSEIPEEWINLVQEWIEMNREFKSDVDNVRAPVVNDEYFIYQSILGGLPEDLKVNSEFVQRLKEYIIKVVREAKVHSNWESPNESYENSCTTFIEKILEPDSRFLRSFVPFSKNIISVANMYSVAQAVIKMTAPGIPDIYQGCELWDLSYVDPDNRRPVDFVRRSQMLQALKEADLSGWEKMDKLLQQQSWEGIEKLFSVWKILNFRKAWPHLFNNGSYIPLTIGKAGLLVIGFARHVGKDWCIVVVPFHLARKNKIISEELAGNFISLPANCPYRWRNIFTGKMLEREEEGLSLSELLGDFPVAVLKNEDEV